MKRNLLLLSVIACMVFSLSAKTRTAAQAMELASQFANQSVSSPGMKKAPSLLGSGLTLSYTSTAKIGENTPYYIFDKGNDRGYVIVSGDDRTKAILGYTDSGRFDIAVLPPEMKEWLAFYETEIASLPDTAIQTVSYTAAPAISNVKSEVASEFSTSITPLLGNIKWNQGSPYNGLCPVINDTTVEKAVTGCVATGMVQVMRYYKWPAHGSGSNTYTTATLKIPLSVDFSKSTFDWDNMAESYSSSTTAAQNTAVATLMYNCGVSVSMDYNHTSNASAKTMAIALKNNFGYDTNLQYRYRDFCSRAEWVNLLKAELNAFRPVLYRGSTTEAGHIFVCDGYDSNGLFHFNWGWGGMSNGYFQISALDPDNQGIGSSVGGYNEGQGIVTGVQKPNAASVPSYLIHVYQALTASADSVARTANFSVVAKQMYNMGVNSFTGYLGIALYNSSGFVQVLKYSSVTALKNDYGWSTYTSTTTLPTTIANGNYKIYFVYKATADNSWQIVRGKIGTPNNLDVKVGSSYIYFKTPVDAYPVLAVNSIGTTGCLYHNKTGRFNVSITNSGAEYNSILGVYLQSTANDTVCQMLDVNTVNVAAGETRNLEFTGTISMNPGQYRLYLMYDSGNNTTVMTRYYSLGNPQIVNILAEPTICPSLTLRSVITFPDQNNVDKNNSILTAKIKNTAGFFDNKLVAFIFPVSGGGSLAYLGYQSAILDMNEEKTITFSGAVDLAPAQYIVAVYYLNETGNWIRITPLDYSHTNFTLVDNHTGLLSPNETSFKIYPNPVHDMLQFKTDRMINRVVITDLLGKQLKSIDSACEIGNSISVGDLKSGVYLISIETGKEIKTGKFIKN